MFGGIGFGELVVIAIVLVIAVGPDKMPTFLKTTVKGFRQFQKTTRDLRSAVNIDRIIGDVPTSPARPPQAALQFTEYERERENPRFGPDLEFAYQQQVADEGQWRSEYPPEGPDVAFALLAAAPANAVPVG